MTGQQAQRDISQYLMEHYNCVRPINSSMGQRRRKLKNNSELCPVSVDHYSQASSSDWHSFLKTNNVISSMSRRGNCNDNAVAESFFQLCAPAEYEKRYFLSPESAYEITGD
ncbi:Integrase core domain protein [compost metagenome]